MFIKIATRMTGFCLTLSMLFGIFTVPASAATLYSGSRGTQVKYLQMNLNGMGYGSLSVDSQYGPKTKSAVMKFQRAYNLSADGIAGTKTLSKMDALVKELQRKLKALGYTPMSVDGIYGSNTTSGVKRFQQANGLKVTGIADKNTLYVINAIKNANVQISVPGSVTVKPGTSLNFDITFSGKGIGGISLATVSGSGFSARIIKSTWKAYPSECTAKIQIVPTSKAKSGKIEVRIYGDSKKTLIKTSTITVNVKATTNVTSPKTSSSSTSKVTSSATTNETKFRQLVYNTAHAQLGQRYAEKKDYTDPWCGRYANDMLKSVYSQLGVEAKNYIPVSYLHSATETAWEYIKGGYGDYYCCTTWNYTKSGKKMSGSPTKNQNTFVPKVGDIALIETLGTKRDGPDHVALIIKVNGDGSFVTSEGNTGSGNQIERQVKEYTYKKDEDGIWKRNGKGAQVVHMICSVKVPN